jgi:hypothetical protein
MPSNMTWHFSGCAVRVLRSSITDLPGSPVDDFLPIRSRELRAASADNDVWNGVCTVVGDCIEVVVCWSHNGCCPVAMVRNSIVLKSRNASKASAGSYRRHQPACTIAAFDTAIARIHVSVDRPIIPNNIIESLIDR